MKSIRFWLRPLFGFLVLLNLMGLSGRERYVELEGFLNGRSQARFRAEDRNIRALLSKGTRGEILQSKKLSSGNYALYVKTLNGSYRGQGFWVYYNVNEPALSVYEKAPADWGAQAPRAPVAQTRKDVEAYRAPAGPNEGMTLPPMRSAPQAGDAGKDSAAQLMRQLKNVDIQIRGAGQVSTPANTCANCVGAAPRTQVREPIREPVGRILAPPTKSSAVSESCHELVRADGSYGPQGLAMAKMMSHSKYRDSYLRDNALGAFCPKFSKLSPQMKLKAWTWYWTVLGMRESTCNVKKEHPIYAYSRKHGGMIRLNPRPGYGFFAAEKDANLRADTRGSACANIATFEGQALCAIDIMYKNQLSRGQTASNSDRKYWGPTFDSRWSSELGPRLRRFTACF